MSTHPADSFVPTWPRSFVGWTGFQETPDGGLEIDLTDDLGYRVPLWVHLVEGGFHVVLGEPGRRFEDLLSRKPSPVAAIVSQESVLDGHDAVDVPFPAQEALEDQSGQNLDAEGHEAKNSDPGALWLSGDRMGLRIGRDAALSLWTFFDSGARHLVWATGPMAQADDPPAEAWWQGIGYAPDGPTWLALPLEPGEALYGLGERFGSLNHRGQQITLWADDAFGLPSDESYIGIPFLMSTRGWALLLPTAAPTRWDIGHTHAGTLEVMAAESWLEFYVVAGGLKEALSFLQGATGPATPVPEWSYGVWMSRWGYRTQEELLSVARELRRRHLPVDVLHLDPYWLTEKNGHTCPWEWDPKSFPDPDAMYRELADLGIRLSLWVNPFLPRGSAVYDEARKRGYLVEHPDGTVARVPRFDDDNAAVDFTHPDARAFFADLVRRELRRGASVLKTDFGETAPYRRIRMHDGSDGETGRNLNGLLYQRTAYEASRDVHGSEALVWGRSGYLGSQRYPLQWGGDSGATWEYMATALRGALSYGLSGAIFTAFDGGGFFGTPSPELYLRWAAMSMLFSHTRFHGTSPREPWAFGEDSVAVWRRLADLRYQLLPYLWHEGSVAVAEGLPLVRPMVLLDPDDPTLYSMDDQYTLGRDLLVAPLFNREGTRRVYLPKGLWHDWFHPEAGLIEGARFVRREAVPLDETALYVRAGAVLPLHPPGSDRVPTKPVPSLRLRVFPGADGPSQGELYGTSYALQDGRWHFAASAATIVECPDAPPRKLEPGGNLTLEDHS